MQLMKEKQDLTYLSWSVYRNSSGTAGSFLKAYSELGGKKTYYKLSNFDKARGIIGHECVNELIVDRLLMILGIPHLSYQLIHADVAVDGRTHEVYLCASEDFKAKSESKIALDAYKELEALPDESALEFCIRMGWEDYIYQMLVVDYLILNRDRHGANIEVLRRTMRSISRNDKKPLAMGDCPQLRAFSYGFLSPHNRLTIILQPSNHQITRIMALVWLLSHCYQ